MDKQTLQYLKAPIKRHDVVKLALHGRRRKIGRF